MNAPGAEIGRSEPEGEGQAQTAVTPAAGLTPLPDRQRAAL